MLERIVVATPGGEGGPSAQARLGPLSRRGAWPIEFHSAGSFPAESQIATLLIAASKTSALILQRVMPSAADMRRLRQGFGSILFDLDDAIYAVPPDLRGSHLLTTAKRAARLVTRGSMHASARKKALIETLSLVDVAVVGNGVLGTFVGRHAKSVVEIPSTVEPVATPSSRDRPPVVVWMGLPDNLQYLELVRGALRRLWGRVPFRLRIVSTQDWLNAPVETEFVPWSEAASRRALLSSTVGIAPLSDDPWTRGKCAYRSIQYGGHGLAAVASPVGITDRVVLDGSTGYLARTDREWEAALLTLITNRGQAAAMGAAALAHIRGAYSDSVAVARWSELISSL